MFSFNSSFPATNNPLSFKIENASKISKNDQKLLKREKWGKEIQNKNDKNTNNNQQNNNNNNNNNNNIKKDDNNNNKKNNNNKEKISNLLLDLSKLKNDEKEMVYQIICEKFDQYVCVETNDNLEQNVEINFSIMEKKHLNSIIDFVKNLKFYQKQHLNLLEMEKTKTEKEKNIGYSILKKKKMTNNLLKEQQNQHLQQQQQQQRQSHIPNNMFVDYDIINNQKKYPIKNNDKNKKQHILTPFPNRNSHDQKNNHFSTQSQSNLNKQYPENNDGYIQSKENSSQFNNKNDNFISNTNKELENDNYINIENNENGNGNTTENSKDFEEKSSSQNAPLEIIEFDFNTFETTHRKTTLLDLQNFELTINDPKTPLNENNSIENINKHII